MNAFKRKSDLIWQPPTPNTEDECLALCGGFDLQAAENYWQANADQHAVFSIVGDKEPPRKMQLWRVFRKVLGIEPDLTPQPTGNCVAASSDDIMELTQGVEIGLGEAEEFHPIFNPFHYATGRVIIGKNRLRGGAGSIGAWQARAIQKYGVIRLDQEGLPKYTKRNVDAWGDDRKAEGKSFRDYMEQGKDHVIRATARVTTVDKVVQSLGSLYGLTIAANFLYEMKPNKPEGIMRQGNKDGGHQMSVWGYDLDRGTVEIKNQWGDVHGKLIDPDDGVELPRGFIRTDMETFERHLNRAECISYSGFEGFPEQRFDFGRWT